MKINLSQLTNDTFADAQRAKLSVALSISSFNCFGETHSPKRFRPKGAKPLRELV